MALKDQFQDDLTNVFFNADEFPVQATYYQGTNTHQILAIVDFGVDRDNNRILTKRHAQVINVDESNENIDWPKTPENLKSEREIHQQLEKEYREQQEDQEPTE